MSVSCNLWVPEFERSRFFFFAPSFEEEGEREGYAVDEKREEAWLSEMRELEDAKGCIKRMGFSFRSSDSRDESLDCVS